MPEGRPATPVWGDCDTRGAAYAAGTPDTEVEVGEVAAFDGDQLAFGVDKSVSTSKPSVAPDPA